ncbi:hypothetical protein NDN08_004952 [Rhodosorus marinus]|uniref:Potassium channel tetramerisation-type BTB domain-containing protein n=1 Tax=Rhodosorus marinus TaxID=101924 RepID=A0AAV8UIJ2_9RHOD|nr:hypothetical protein NDN08_004952 [Rhodosorus marinus]
METSMESTVASSVRQDVVGVEQEGEGDETTLAKLDIGGTRFITTIGSLRRIPQCVLSGESIIAACRTPKKVPFIDRDPEMFPYILNFLRDPLPQYFVLPETCHEKKKLLREAVYYNIPGLVKLLESNLSCFEQSPPDPDAPTARFLYINFERQLTYQEHNIVSASYVINGEKIKEETKGWFGKKGISMAEVESAFRFEISKTLERYSRFGYDLQHMDSTVSSTALRSTTVGDKASFDHLQTLIVTAFLERTRS